MIDRPEPQALAPSPRVALLSIAGFWAFYFAIVTVRSTILDPGDPWELVGRRTIVTVVSAGVTLLLYLVLRRLPRRSLAMSVATAAAFAVPAALLYSTVNWFAFRTLNEREMTRKERTKTVVIETPRPAADARQRQISIHLEDDAGRKSEPDVLVQDGTGRTIPQPPQPGAMPAPPAPPVPAAVARRIMVQVGGADESTTEHLTPLEGIADQAANGYFFIAAWAALFLALGYAAEVQAAERRAARFRAAAQAAEIRALRYQVNPHFLFNTLNSLSSLVMTGRAEAAERMILNLATFFRTSLTGDPAEDVRLDEEIRLQRLYLDIEAVRFPDRLVVAVDLPTALAGACVPGLILQPLVENAVKYGVAPARRPVTIRIAAQQEGNAMRLTVEDDGDPPADAPEATGTGVGLRNVRDRIAARFGDAAACSWGPRAGGGFAVTLLLPIVRRDC